MISVKVELIKLNYKIIGLLGHRTFSAGDFGGIYIKKLPSTIEK